MMIPASAQQSPLSAGGTEFFPGCVGRLVLERISSICTCSWACILKAFCDHLIVLFERISMFSLMELKQLLTRTTTSHCHSVTDCKPANTWKAENWSCFYRFR